MLSHLELLKYCLASYAGNVDSFRKELRILGKIDSYYGDSLHKYTVELDDCYVIVFRGSENKFDFFNDIASRSVDFNGTNIHAGFLDQLSAEAFPRLDFDFKKKIYLTGHSLGGALATIFADKLATYQFAIYQHADIELITFAAPKCGALSFKQQIELKLEDNITNYVCGDDIVPSLPPRYVKVGKEIKIGKKHSWWNPLKYYHLFKDHSIYEYLKSMGFNNNA